MCNYIQTLADNIHVYEEKLPYSVRAFVTPQSDCGYTIYLNQYLSNETKLSAIQHEMEHIRNNDLQKEDSAVEREKEI